MTRLRRRALAALLALGSVGAGGRALTPAAEPAFQKVIHAVNVAHRLGDGARVEGVSIEPIDARLSLGLEGASVVVHLDDRDEGGSGARSRWFRLTTEPPGALSPEREARLLALLDESFPEDPFVSAGVSGPHAPPGGGFDRPRTLDTAVRLELAHSLAESEYVSWRAMAARLLLLSAGLGAGLLVVARAKPR